ncbi:hypothetical protein FIU83_03935 [Halomonas sp. THAF5a]|uniref:hypothetical protein n=1 Tax=Halomonas sp. THAF5a TaxID=2587844 RepID=UPI00126888D6|nr:hypothetical protein [Halomonas sp. THAF5a]QFU00783.1 hypothetical protein FIU83_03935 [Halomonas sp. THAF5a]
MVGQLTLLMLWIPTVAFAQLSAAPAVAQQGATVEGPRILTIDDGAIPRGWTERLSERAAELPDFDPSGYRRPDFLPEIFAERFNRAPARGLDNTRYWATSLADLAAACPALGLDSVSHEALPYIFASAADLFERFQSGNLSDSEILQAGWVAILGINASNACSWDSSGSMTRDQAQAMCDDASAARRDLGVLPSPDARWDVALFLDRYGCNSPQARHLAEGLRDFGRGAPGRMFRSARLPPADTAEGGAYREIIRNCNRKAFSEKDAAWCGCYVDTLYRLSPPQATVDALASDPFAGASPIHRITALPGGDAVFECTAQHFRAGDPRESYREKPTACLVAENPRDDGRTDCVYRAAWGTFLIPDEVCRPEFTSRSWGSVEVDCATGGTVAAAPEGARRWTQGVYTTIDWENAVPDDFEPPLPKDARDNWPLQMRFLTRKEPGQLTRQSLGEISEFEILRRVIMPNDPIAEAFPGAFSTLRAEGALVLTCTWTTGRGSTMLGHYWYEETPGYVQDEAYPPVLAELFTPIGEGRESCPSRAPE